MADEQVATSTASVTAPTNRPPQRLSVPVVGTRPLPETPLAIIAKEGLTPKKAKRRAHIPRWLVDELVPTLDVGGFDPHPGMKVVLERIQRLKMGVQKGNERELAANVLLFAMGRLTLQTSGPNRKEGWCLINKRELDAAMKATIGTDMAERAHILRAIELMSKDGVVTVLNTSRNWYVGPTRRFTQLWGEFNLHELEGRPLSLPPPSQLPPPIGPSIPPPRS